MNNVEKGTKSTTKNERQYGMDYLFEDNLCYICLKDKGDDPHAACAECRAKTRAMRKRKREKNIALGLCVYCNKPNSNGRPICDSCRKKNTEYNKKYREMLNKANLCAKCGRNRLAPGHTVCEKCLEKGRIRSKKNSLIPTGKPVGLYNNPE